MKEQKIDKLYSQKQQEVLRYYYNNDFGLLINHGAVRTGKTIIDNDLFIAELIRVRNYATKYGIVDPQYILAGASIGNIHKNVLSDLTKKYGVEFKPNKYNQFKFLGVNVCMTGHDDIGQVKGITGMTAYGAYINEGALAKREAFDEILKRVSGDKNFHARTIIDTNPDNPQHWLKKDYIDREQDSGGRIKCFHWKLSDNPFLNEEYVNDLKASTPSGVFFDRKINGQWVSADGAVYSDFDENVHIIDIDQMPEFVSFFAGVDWGYEHKGSIVVIGETAKGEYVVVEEITQKHKLIEWWIAEAQKLEKKYMKMPFYADSARPDNISAFNQMGILTYKAKKEINQGVEDVARRLKCNTLRFYKYGIKDLLSEMYSYVWDEKTGLPIKVNDDTVDALRYGVFTRDKMKGVC